MKNTPIRILVADDDDAHRNMLLLLLRDWHYEAQGVADGEQAVLACKETPFDLVLMDVRMPNMSGLEALGHIKKHNPAIAILIMTAYSNVEAAVEAMKGGAYDYHTKPLDFDKLKLTLERIFSQRELEKENKNLRLSLQEKLGHNTIIGRSKTMQEAVTLAQAIAPSEATVLITGESGTGKEVMAKAIHLASERKNGPFIAVNCAAITESLLESELFGHEKGAFTGADKRREGRFAAANGGTLFLDEIGEMPLSMQVKLLRALQEREVQPVGGDKPVPVNVRILAATNRNLVTEVQEGRFREDLYYRLNVVSLPMPPLRHREGDVPLLADFFARLFAEKNHKYLMGFTPQALDRLIRYQWPGNVRELENVMERAIVLLVGDTITERELPLHLVQEQTQDLPQSKMPGNLTLEELERLAIQEALENTGNNKSEAARRLGITRKTLHTKVSRYNLE